MVEAYGLTQCSAAKYVAGIELVGEDRFTIPAWKHAAALEVK
jgi:hypothetical protein